MRADPAQVRAMVAAYAPDNRGQVLALAADPEWAGPEILDAGPRRVKVKACPAPLAVRDAMLGCQEDGDQLLVLLTTCSGPELGLDVRLRLVKGDVLPLDPFVSVLALFGASVLDPELAGQRWLIDDLVARAPATGWTSHLPLGGLLDVDTAWRAWHEARLGLDAEPSSLAAIVALGEKPELCARVGELPAGTRKELGERWAGLAGGAAPLLVDLLAGGHGPDLAPLGLVAGVLWAVTNRPGAAAQQALARARLETLFGRDRLSPQAATEWANAVGALLAASPREGVATDKAEHYLEEAGALELAYSSDILPKGFDLRLQAVGEALLADDVAEAAAQLGFVRRHRRAGRRDHRVATATAALALLRRRHMVPSAPPAGSFPGAAQAYATDGAFVDEAVRLLREGESEPRLAEAYASLAAGAEEERAPSMAEFAKLLSDWSRSEPVPDGRIVPLENLLADVVAPVARDAPVLLVVCDGMSLAVAHELARDLLEENWAPAAPEGRDAWPVGVALLPTVTEVSRASLLAGQRVKGDQGTEKERFSANPAVTAVSAPTRPPVLFHKAELVGPSGNALPNHVRETVADAGQRVVGVVVNAVDDHLGRGDQVRLGWDLSSLRPLSWLLDAALEADRVLVLVADHGHVLHGPTSALRPSPVGGERWRVTPPDPLEDEVEVTGPRVLLGQGKVVLPAKSALHYSGHKYGYHGGATPEEVLVPVEVLARRLPAGWRHRPPAVPAWWRGEEESVAAPPPPLPPPGVLPQATTGQGTLFGGDLGPSPAGEPRRSRVEPERNWVDELLTSPVFVGHRQRLRLPRPLPDSALRTYLAAIDGNGGAIPLAALSARTGEPLDTLRMALSFVQRLVNLDGAEVLAVRADGTVELNRELASLQFELGPQ